MKLAIKHKLTIMCPGKCNMTYEIETIQGQKPHYCLFCGSPIGCFPTFKKKTEKDLTGDHSKKFWDRY